MSDKLKAVIEKLKKEKEESTKKPNEEEPKEEPNEEEPKEEPQQESQEDTKAIDSINKSIQLLQNDGVFRLDLLNRIDKLNETLENLSVIIAEKK